MPRWIVLFAAVACSSRDRPAHTQADDPPAAAAPAAKPSGGAPHGTMSTDVSKMGLPPPDPNRKMDASHHVKGTIRVADALKDRVKPGGAVFVVVKHGDASGNPSGPPLAVRRLGWDKNGMPFVMTEAQAMIAGTELSGEVIVTARYDQDGDALTKQAGDVVGAARVTVPADDVDLVLDHVLP